jgi:hypothetical protein
MAQELGKASGKKGENWEWMMEDGEEVCDLRVRAESEFPQEQTKATKKFPARTLRLEKLSFDRMNGIYRMGKRLDRNNPLSHGWNTEWTQMGKEQSRPFWPDGQDLKDGKTTFLHQVRTSPFDGCRLSGVPLRPRTDAEATDGTDFTDGMIFIISEGEGFNRINSFAHFWFCAICGWGQLLDLVPAGFLRAPRKLLQRDKFSQLPVLAQPGIGDETHQPLEEGFCWQANIPVCASWHCS